jgi:hypothetical protein
MRESFSRAVGNVISVTVFIAVPAFAIYFADVSIFAESVRPQEVRSVAARATSDDALLLNNWQFTDKKFDDNNNQGNDGNGNGNGNGDGNDNGKGKKTTKPTKETKKTQKMSKNTGH